MRRAADALVLLPALAACAAIAALFPATARDAWLVPAFLLVFFLLPGLALGRLLIRQELSPAEAAFLGYPLSTSLFFLLFWFGGLLRQPLLPLAMLPLALWALARILGGRMEAMDWRAALCVAVPHALSCALLIAFLLAYNSVLPKGDALLFVNKDFSILNAVTTSLSRFASTGDFQDPFMAGLPFNYHILQYIPLAFLEQFTGQQQHYALLFVSPVVSLLMLCGAIVVGGVRLARLPLPQAAVLCALVLFTSGTLDYWYAFQVYYAPLSFFFSLPFFFLFLFSIMGALQRGEDVNAPYSALAHLAAGGSKGPLIVVLPLALIPAYVARVRRLGLRLRDLGLGLGIVLSALLLRYTMFHSPFRHSMAARSLASGLLSVANMVLKLLACPEVAFLLILLATDRIFRIRHHKHLQSFLFLGGMVLACAVVPYVLGFEAETLYYTWFARLALVVAGTFAIQYALERRKAAHLALAALVIALGLFNFAKFQIPLYRAATPATPPTLGESLDGHEYEALSWLKAHAEPGSCFFSNRIAVRPVHSPSEVTHKDYFLFYHYAGYAGIPAYLASTSKEVGERLDIQQNRLKAIVAFTESATPEEGARRLAEIPAQYFVQCLRFERRDYSAVPGLTPVFRNPSVIIYRTPHAAQ